MISPVAVCAGAAYAGGLWSIAGGVARHRAIPLGRLPVWVLALGGACAAAADMLFAPTAAFGAAAVLIGAIVCAAVDARTGFIFDALSLTIATVAGALAAADHRLADAALAAAAVGGVLAAIYFLSRRRGIGLGDVKLAAAIALGYGLPSSLVAIGSAFVLGALYAGGLLALGRAKRTDALRFGPFIAGGAVIGLTAGALRWPW